MFIDREDAGRQVAEMLKGRPLHDPIVEGIPRGGVVIGAVLARELGADLDVVLSRKIRSPTQPELAIGAVAEDGRTFLNEFGREYEAEFGPYLDRERTIQLAAIEERKRLFRGVRPQAPVAGRSVIVTDDGIATGSTVLAALETLRQQQPRELIVAVPVGAPDRLAEIARSCDEVYCVERPRHFWAIGNFYEDFSQVEDDEVIRILREFAVTAAKQPSNRA